MPPKQTWKALSRVATSPFRKSLSGDSLAAQGAGKPSSKPPSRKPSMELPQADSPTSMATPPIGDGVIQPSDEQSSPQQDDDAVNLSSPVDGAVPYTIPGAKATGDPAPEHKEPNGYVVSSRIPEPNPAETTDTDRKVQPINVAKAIQDKADVLTPELTPEEGRTDANEEIPSITTPQMPAQEPVHPVSPLASTVDYGEDHSESKYGVITGEADPFADSQVLLVPRSARIGSARPYTIQPIGATAATSAAQVEIRDDDGDGLVAEPHVTDGFPGMTNDVVDPRHMEGLELDKWAVFYLPNGAKYFHHAESRIVTDVDISLPGNLQKVASHLRDAVQAMKQYQSPGPVGRLVDDTTPPVSSAGEAFQNKVDQQLQAGEESRTVYGTTPVAFTFGNVANNSIGTELWLGSLSSATRRGGDIVFAPITLWVDHLAKSVSTNPPWDANEDDEGSEGLARYWRYLEQHPSHIGLPGGSAEKAIEAVSWCYTDLLLHPFESHNAQPFTLSECRELLEILKTPEVQSVGSLQTHIVSKILRRLAKHHRQQDAIKTAFRESSEPAHQAQKSTFGNFLGRLFVIFFCFGLPYKYVAKNVAPRHHWHRHGQADSRVEVEPLEGALLADSPIFAASIALLAPVFITTAVLLLTLPGLANAAQLAVFISIFLSTSSLGASIINLQRRAFTVKTHLEVESAQAKPKTQGNGPFVQSLPLVFLAWAVIALITSVFLYLYRVSAFPSHEHQGEVLNDVLRLVVVAVGSSLGLVLLLAACANRRKVVTY